MRGKAYKMWAHLEVIRITPAYAGKSYREKFTHMIRKDHPRLCGEKRSRNDCRGRLLGSPPPMRGKVEPHQRTAEKCKDHPRLCGEKYP